ncbi:hypothetical protein Vgi01_19240 [Micromonospora gifhornensis]|uniref:Uncharacterized protein n=1 Tax=Micromonospora gifhornensis TaxID=84594 RepID=A0ABQ4IBG2_9ACTN|nr:hypothetical protein Vgi01_19240 [Micromonospora gifhornensis]
MPRQRLLPGAARAPEEGGKPPALTLLTYSETGSVAGNSGNDEAALMSNSHPPPHCLAR